MFVPSPCGRLCYLSMTAHDAALLRHVRCGQSVRSSAGSSSSPPPKSSQRATFGCPSPPFNALQLSSYLYPPVFPSDHHPIYHRPKHSCLLSSKTYFTSFQNIRLKTTRNNGSQVLRRRQLQDVRSSGGAMEGQACWANLLTCETGTAPCRPSRTLSAT